jgi:histidyl-tRNA synthetase
MGIERVIDLVRESGSAESVAITDVYVLHQGGATQQRAFLLAERLRDAGLDVVLHAGDASLKSQMKKADASGAEFAVIVGEAEASNHAAAIKALRPGAGEAFAEQRIVPLDQIPDVLVEAMSSADNN